MPLANRRTRQMSTSQHCDIPRVSCFPLYPTFHTYPPLLGYPVTKVKKVAIFDTERDIHIRAAKWNGKAKPCLPKFSCVLFSWKSLVMTVRLLYTMIILSYSTWSRPESSTVIAFRDAFDWEQNIFSSYNHWLKCSGLVKMYCTSVQLPCRDITMCSEVPIWCAQKITWAWKMAVGSMTANG